MGGKNKIVVEPYQVEVLVRSPGGKPIAKAEVRLKRNSNAADDDVEETDNNGIARFVIAESDFKDDPNVPGGKAEYTFEARKRHHGPVVIGDSVPFENGPATADVSVEPLSPDKIKVKKQPGWAVGYSPGTPNVDKDGRLNIILVEGGCLGQDHYDSASSPAPASLTKRLSKSQIQEELLFRIGHGDVALTKTTEFEFEHDSSIGDFDACQPGKCKIKKPGVDDKVAVYESRLAGVDFLYIKKFVGVTAVEWARAGMSKLSQRHVVGMARLCKMLRVNHSVAAIYTQGFITSNGDAHQAGRAFDFSGVLLQKPEGSPQAVRTDVDLVVYYHWGNRVRMQVDTTTPKPTDTEITGTNPKTYRRKEDHDVYRVPSDPPTKDALLYRLDPEPLPAERDIATAALPQSHFTKAKNVFLAVYQFATTQYSSRDAYLGPTSALPVTVGSTCDANDGTVPGSPGLIAGYVIHPDYPNPGEETKGTGRAAHQHHIHMQLGRTRPVGVSAENGTWED